nr:hypothetical protein [Lentilactobacillus sp. Marseille-Q4993]
MNLADIGKKVSVQIGDQNEEFQVVAPAKDQLDKSEFFIKKLKINKSDDKQNLAIKFFGSEDMARIFGIVIRKGEAIGND